MGKYVFMFGVYLPDYKNACSTWRIETGGFYSLLLQFLGSVRSAVCSVVRSTIHSVIHTG